MFARENCYQMTPVEQKIIEILRELKPFEVVRIVKDQNGKPDHYFVERTQKVVINNSSTCLDNVKKV